MGTSIPRISVLPLAEYLDADVTRRAALVGQAQDTNEAAAYHYNRARQELIRILRSGSRHDARLLDAAQCFRDEIPSASSEWNARDFELCAEALECLSRSLDAVDLGDGAIRGDRRWPPLKMEGVRISVAPDLIVHEAGDPTKVGGIKFRFGKNRQMTATEGEYASTILRYYLRQYVTTDSRKLSHRLCQVVDVFPGQVFVAKRAFKRRIERVRKACVEFGMHWNRVSEPARPRSSIRPVDMDLPQPPALH